MGEGLPSELAVWDLVYSNTCPAAPTLVYNRFSSYENMRNITQSSCLHSEVYLVKIFVRLHLFPLVLDFPLCVLQLILFPCCLSQNPNYKTRHRLKPQGNVVITSEPTCEMWFQHPVLSYQGLRKHAANPATCFGVLFLGCIDSKLHLSQLLCTAVLNLRDSLQQCWSGTKKRHTHPSSMKRNKCKTILVRQKRKRILVHI